MNCSLSCPNARSETLNFALMNSEGEEVGRECGGRTVYANTGLHFPIVSVEKLEQGHLYARITLKHVPDRGGIEVLFPFHEGIEGRVYGKQ